eukprot:scaffold41252_cov59-Attheya_sp.AAC.1
MSSLAKQGCRHFLAFSTSYHCCYDFEGARNLNRAISFHVRPRLCRDYPGTVQLYAFFPGSA